ncbi:MAG: caspase family protein, partial [Calditrichaeota bacterium]|nr:caspase family protein [Calditrichota bacterium]
MNKYFFAILLFTSQIFAQSRGAEPIFLASDGSNQPLYSNSYALVVGVSDYTNGWRDLANALNDALEVRVALEAQGFEVQLLENPDKSTLEAAIGEFVNLKGTDPQNRLLFYFAGHGHSMELAQGINMGYIIPADAPMPPEPDEDDPVKRANFKQGALDMDAFFNYSRRIESKHVLFIFDSCFSGSMFSTMRGSPSATVLNAAKEPVRQFITAGDANETVPDVSIFKQQFLRALNGDADTAPKDGYLTGTELGLFLKDRVIHYSQNRQHPQYGKIYDAALDRGDFIFSVSDSTSGEANTSAIVTSNSNSQPRAEIGQLSGLVLSDINEKPISDAVVTLISSFGESKYLVRSQSRQDGSFSLAFEWGKVQSLLDDGATWELTVTRDGYGTFAKPVSFTNGQVDP